MVNPQVTALLNVGSKLQQCIERDNEEEAYSNNNGIRGNKLPVYLGLGLGLGVINQGAK